MSSNESESIEVKGKKRKLSNSVDDDPVLDNTTLQQAEASRSLGGSEGTKRRKQLIQKINSRFFSHLRKKCQSWVLKTTPTEPSFCLLYWRSVRGHQEIVWEGPDHMRPFTESQTTIEAFKSVALSQAPKSVSKQCTTTPDEALRANPLLLRSSSPGDYRNDILAKIIPTILNPLGMRNYYSDPSNCPRWFPKSVEFRRPNHPTRGNKRMTAGEMRRVLQSFFDNCPNSYKIADVDECDKLAEIKDNIAIDTSDSFEPMMIEAKVEVQDVLKQLEEIQGWEEFCSKVKDVGKLIDFSFMSECRIRCVEEVTQKIDWRRKQLLKNEIPDGYIPCFTSAEGDCLFCAVSLALFGKEQWHKELRLLAVVHAVSYFKYYLKMLITEITTIDDAQQFLCTVASTDAQFQQQPQDSSVSDTLMYTLKSEIVGTATLGSYSGLLQILFLAGATGFAIQQHCEVKRDGYNTTLHPCSGDIKGIVHIMWVQMDPASTMNHIIPLLKSSCDQRTTALSSKAPDFIRESIQYNLCAFCANSATETADKNMVQCDSCSRWFHCTCIGVSIGHFTNDRNFFCCKSITPENDFEVLHAQRGKNRSILKFSDVQTLHPTRGISDGVIDFFVRILLPKSVSAFTTSALAYTAITRAIQSSDNVKTLFFTTTGKLDLTQPLILFPCCVQAVWHWILIAVYSHHEIAFVIDPMSPRVLKPYSYEVVEKIGSLFNVSLKPVACQVPLQEGVDCGVHVMHHIRTISKNPGVTILDNPDLLRGPVYAALLRQEILALCCKHSRGIVRKTTRLSQAEIKRKQLTEITKMMKAGDHSGLKIVSIHGKGMGVKTTRHYQKEEYVCEYKGDLIPHREAEQKEEKYLQEHRGGKSYRGYMFYFTFDNKRLCIDATKNTGHVGRMINHSKTAPNIVPTVVSDKGVPHICFIAKKDIPTGTELNYDYGDRTSDAIRAHPWLAK